MDSGEGVLNTCLTISIASLPERVGTSDNCVIHYFFLEHTQWQISQK